MKSTAFIGSWRITEMELWDREAWSCSVLRLSTSVKTKRATSSLLPLRDPLIAVILSDAAGRS